MAGGLLNKSRHNPERSDILSRQTIITILEIAHDYHLLIRFFDFSELSPY